MSPGKLIRLPRLSIIILLIRNYLSSTHQNSFLMADRNGLSSEATHHAHIWARVFVSAADW